MFNEAVITTAGLALDAKIRSGETAAEFTRMGLGDGEYDGSEELDSAAALKSIRQSIGISSIKRTNETTVRLRVIVDNGGIEEGYYISELGIFANDPDVGEILYSIATGVVGKMDYQPSEDELVGATSTIDVFTSVSNAKYAVIATGTGAAASADELADLEVRVSEMENPEFDDSGKVAEIKSFPDFLERVKSKMNFFGFLRDFKAGMQFVLHAGDVVNDCESDAMDKPLAAAQGKALMDQYTELKSDMTGANNSTPGKAGLVPAPAAGAQGKYLRGDGTWQNPPDTNTTYSVATQNAAGLMSADDKKKLDGVAASANNYSHPTSAGNKHIPSGGSSGQILRWSADGTAEWGNDNNTTYSNMKAATASAAGSAGLVPAPAAGAQGKYLRGDGTWQTPPDTNTTYSAATQSVAGLMSADDKKKLDGVAASANNYSHPTSAGNKHIPSGGSSGQILRWSADGTAAWGADNNTTYSNMKAASASAAGSAGLVPAPAAGAQGKFLRGDGTWQTPTNTTYSNMKAASADAAGSAGLVPAPAAGKQSSYLRGDGTWATPTNTTYSNMKAASADAAGSAGLVPAPAAGAQGKFLRGDGKWATPTDTNTTYNAATQSAAGLMSAADKKKLDGVATGANVTPSGLSSGYVRSGQKSGTTAGNKATAEGEDTTASGLCSHAEGYGSAASAVAAHAEGNSTIASLAYAHAEGNMTVASGQGSHAEGYGTTASGLYAHAEGYLSVASDSYAHAEGYGTTASGNGSHAEGNNTTASGAYQTAIGIYNTETTQANGLFIVGNGSVSATSNAFRVTKAGATYAKGNYNASGADYAEYFEWEDGNPDNEDRRGYFVTMEGDKIKKASSADSYILGVISGKPSVIGNSDPDDWHGHFLRDEFGEYIMEKVKQTRMEPYAAEAEEPYIDEDGNEAVRTVTKILEREVEEEADSYILNPDYDPDKEYTPRAERQEWAAVGMLGVLLVRDDGTCQVNGYCRAADGGIAAASDTGWRVIKRVSDHLVKIVFR